MMCLPLPDSSKLVPRTPRFSENGYHANLSRLHRVKNRLRVAVNDSSDPLLKNYAYLLILAQGHCRVVGKEIMRHQVDRFPFR